MNIFADVKEFLENEEFQALASSEYVKIERIVSTGHRSPEDFWYHQEQNEWVLVLSGSGVQGRLREYPRTSEAPGQKDK